MKIKWYTYIAFIFALWFVLTSWIWFPLFFNIWGSYPFGLAALILYVTGKFNNPGTRLNKIVLITLLAGMASSIVAFVLFFGLIK